MEAITLSSERGQYEASRQPFDVRRLAAGVTHLYWSSNFEALLVFVLYLGKMYNPMKDLSTTYAIPVDSIQRRTNLATGGAMCSSSAGQRLLHLLSVTGLVAALALSRDGASLRAQGQPSLPARFDSYVKAHVKLTADKHKRLLAGQPVTQLLATDPAKEVAIFGAVWVNAPMARYLTAVKDIESFEKGDSFLVTKRISDPPRLEDFDQLSLPPDDIADLKTCKVGNCEVKVSEAALTRIQQETDWSKPTATADVERLIRRLALEYVTGYLEGGNSRLAVYRDAKRPTFVAQEFAAMVDRMPEMTHYRPDLKKYLLDYPKVILPNAESFLYWQKVTFGLKPTIRINHLTIADQQSHAAVVSKMLYASHYFWTAIELRFLVPHPARGEGFWFANVSRSRADGLGGFVGSLIRGRVRGETEKGMQAALAMTKRLMEH